MTQQKYVVRLIRPVFQTAYLEVQGKDENEALCNAALQADEVPESEWKGRFNAVDYWYDIDCVHTGETAEGHQFTLLDFPLYALMGTKEMPTSDRCTTHPWMNYVEPATLGLIYSRWINELREERVMYYKETAEQLQALLRAYKETDGKVVPLRPPVERRDMVALLEVAVETAQLLAELE